MGCPPLGSLRTAVVDSFATASSEDDAAAAGALVEIVGLNVTVRCRFMGAGFLEPASRGLDSLAEAIGYAV